jgi:hypothetical protein
MDSQTLLAIVVPVTLFVIWLFAGRRDKSARVTYHKNTILFSPEERALFAVLKTAVQDDFEIFAKVRASDLVTAKSGKGRSGEARLQSFLADQQFPFVLCNKSDLTVACAIQLEERVPGQRRAAPHEQDLRSVCESASLPMVPIVSSPLYDALEIRQAILQAIRQEPFHAHESDGRREPHISSLDGIGL